jgi:hypothetical protein
MEAIPSNSTGRGKGASKRRLSDNMNAQQRQKNWKYNEVCAHQMQRNIIHYIKGACRSKTPYGLYCAKMDKDYRKASKHDQCIGATKFQDMQG